MSKNEGLLAPFQRQWRTLLVCLGIALLAALMYLMLAKPMYQAEARLRVRPGTGDVTERFLQLQASRLTDFSVLTLALNNGQIGDSVTLREMGENRRLEYLRENLSARANKNAEQVVLSLTTSSADDSAAIVNSVVDAYMKIQSSDRDDFKTRQLAPQVQLKDQSEQAMEQKRIELEAAKRLADDMGAARGDLTVAQMTNLSAELPKAEQRTLEAKNNYEESRKLLGDDPASQDYLDQANKSGAGLVVSDEELTTYHTQMVDNRQKLADALRSYLPNHPAVVALQEQTNRSIAKYIVAAKSRAMLAEMKESALRDSLNEATRLNRQITERTERLNALKSDFESLQKKRTALETEIAGSTQRFESQSVAIASRDPAVVPSRPISPVTSRVLLVALLCGGIAGLVLSKLRDNAQAGMRSAAEIHNFLGLPVMGSIPTLPKSADEMQRAFACIEPESATAESMRGIRSAIYKGLSKDRAKTLLVCSPETNDGKSLLVTNLAISLVESNLKTLLIDLNLRSPSLHRIFNVPSEIGVAGVLSGEERVEDAIQETDIEMLHVMPAGKSTRNGAELINQPSYVELLDHLSQSYDRIIIDTPAVTSVADARIAAAGVDLTILVVRCSKSQRKVTELTKEGLLSVGANLLGVVVNDVPASQMHDFGGLGYMPYGDSPKKSASEIKNASTSNEHRLIIDDSMQTEG